MFVMFFFGRECESAEKLKMKKSRFELTKKFTPPTAAAMFGKNNKSFPKSSAKILLAQRNSQKSFGFGRVALKQVACDFLFSRSHKSPKWPRTQEVNIHKSKWLLADSPSRLVATNRVNGLPPSLARLAGDRFCCGLLIWNLIEDRFPSVFPQPSPNHNKVSILS